MSASSDDFTTEDEDSPHQTTPREEVYELTEDEKTELCRVFQQLDVDGAGVLDKAKLEALLKSLGRQPFGAELEDIMSYANSENCEGVVGMNYQGFEEYMTKQLRNTSDEDELRKSFETFDNSLSPTGKINVAELRYNLKNKELKLTDDELNFLYREDDYWMLEENMLEYEHLISKILGKPTCNNSFLNC